LQKQNTAAYASPELWILVQPLVGQLRAR